jgi:hypothetical protein
MRRRTVLRRLALAGTGVGLATGTAHGHPTPTGDGTAEPAASDTPTGEDPLGVLEMETVYEVVTSPDGHTAYVATGDGIALVDLVTPTSPRLLSRRTDLLAESGSGPIQHVRNIAVREGRLLGAGTAQPADLPESEDTTSGPKKPPPVIWPKSWESPRRHFMSICTKLRRNCSDSRDRNTETGYHHGSLDDGFLDVTVHDTERELNHEACPTAFAEAVQIVPIPAPAMTRATISSQKR